MPRLLTLSRAARLVGVRRGALQSKIRSGELAAFEGMVVGGGSAARLSAGQAGGQCRAGALRGDQGRRLCAAHARAPAAQRRGPGRAPGRDEPGAGAGPGAARALPGDRGAAAGEAARADGARRRGCSPGCSSAWSPPRSERAAAAGAGEFSEDHDARTYRSSRAAASSSSTATTACWRRRCARGCRSTTAAASAAAASARRRVVSGQVQRTRHSDYALTAAEKNAGVVLMCCNTAARPTS